MWLSTARWSKNGSWEQPLSLPRTNLHLGGLRRQCNQWEHLTPSCNAEPAVLILLTTIRRSGKENGAGNGFVAWSCCIEKGNVEWRKRSAALRTRLTSEIADNNLRRGLLSFPIQFLKQKALCTISIYVSTLSSTEGNIPGSEQGLCCTFCVEVTGKCLGRASLQFPQIHTLDNLRHANLVILVLRLNWLLTSPWAHPILSRSANGLYWTWRIHCGGD